MPACALAAIYVNFVFNSNIVYAHRHCAASMQAVDGSLSFSVSLEFYKSTTFKKKVTLIYID